MGIEQFLVQRAKNEGEVIGMEKGIEKGIEIERTEKNLKFVKSLLTQTDHPVQKIAQLADVTVAFVEEVKASLSGN
jgi:predicted transposase YdaD